MEKIRFACDYSEGASSLGDFKSPDGDESGADAGVWGGCLL